MAQNKLINRTIENKAMSEKNIAAKTKMVQNALMIKLGNTIKEKKSNTP